jgi:hypothetical protein
MTTTETFIPSKDAALACQSTGDIFDGCAWIAQFNELPALRAKKYRCVNI